jgi:hypothetical protein
MDRIGAGQSDPGHRATAVGARGVALKDVERLGGDDAVHAVVVSGEPRFNENAI